MPNSVKASGLPDSRRYFSSLKRRLERLAKITGEIGGSLELQFQDQLEASFTFLENIVKELHKQSPVRQKLKPGQARRELLAKLTDEHITILSFLEDYKYASTGQIKKYRYIQEASRYLSDLEKANMVKSYRYQPELGNAGEKCWWL
jgi:hypothetical protein